MNAADKNGIIHVNTKLGQELKRVISLILILVLQVVCVGDALADNDGYSREFDPANWQSRLKDNVLINEIVLPASHDSGTYNIIFTELGELCDQLVYTIADLIKEKVVAAVGSVIAFCMSEFIAILTPIIRLFAKELITKIQRMCGKCQSKPITAQLEAGVRAFDLRYRYDDGAFHVYHGDETEGLAGIIQTCVCYDEHDRQLRLDECFGAIRGFLIDHPTEFVVVSVQNEGGEYNETVKNELRQLEEQYGIIPYLPGDLTPVRYLRGNIYDCTSDSEDISGRSWDATVEKKKKCLDEALLYDDYAAYAEVQANLAVKMWMAHDPNDECSFPVYVTGWASIFGHNILPTGFSIEIDKMIKTPYAQSTQINPYLHSLLTGKERINPFVNLISTDFVTAEMSCAIVNLNVRRGIMNDTWGYTYSGYDRIRTEKEMNDMTVSMSIDTDELARELLRQAEHVNGRVVWEGDAASVRPEHVVVRLYRQTGGNAAQEIGQLTVSPDAGGRWEFDFGLCPKQENDQPAVYTVRCDELDDYWETTEGYRITFTRKNPLPRTGDATDPVLLAALMTISLAGIVIALSGGRNRKKAG